MNGRLGLLTFCAFQAKRQLQPFDRLLLEESSQLQTELLKLEQRLHRQSREYRFCVDESSVLFSSGAHERCDAPFRLPREPVELAMCQLRTRIEQAVAQLRLALHVVPTVEQKTDKV